MFQVSKATATRDLTDLVEKFKLVERYGDFGAGTILQIDWLIIGSIGSQIGQLGD